MNAQVDIEAGLRRLEHELTRDPDIDAVYMFGSYARKRANPLSDIDIGILLNENVPPGSYFARRLQYMAQCAGVLRTDRVEVVLLNEVSAHLAHEVISCRTILFERNPEHRVRFEVDTIKKYLDFKPFMRVRVKYMKDQLLSGRFFD
jgi:predicted nucleotidyltransferase